MIRLNRVGRERAIITAIKQLTSQGKHQAFTRGEICKKMGITSQSKIRDILDDMAARGLLASGTSAIDGYADEIAIYALAANEQTGIPMSYGTYINGEWHQMNGEVLNDAVGV